VHYYLIARNEQGASVEYRGDTRQDVLTQFDHTFERRGWQIELYNVEDQKKITIKKTFR